MPEIKFENPGTSPAGPPAASAPGAAKLPPIEEAPPGELAPLDEGDPEDFADLTTPAPAPGAGTGLTPVGRRGVSNTRRELPPVGDPFVIHVVEDGFSAHGRVWYRGQELHYVIGEQPYRDTLDRNGDSFLSWGDAEQFAVYGKVIFRAGPWPGADFDDPRAAAREEARSGQPPVLPPVAGRSRSAAR